MSVTQKTQFSAGLVVLFAVWVWPLPASELPSFSLHMTIHMAVVALAPPLLVLGIAGSPTDPVRRWPGAFSTVVASVIELVVVWVWHTPVLHHAAAAHGWIGALEQLTFFAAGTYLWLSAWGGTPMQRDERSMRGVVGLLLTSMHMTLLGVLIALTPRVLYAHHSRGETVSVLFDQQLGGVIMILLGAAAYLVGGVALVSKLMRREAQPGRISGDRRP